VNDLRDTCQSDRAADRAASAARTLAAIAHDAARKYVKRDAVTPQTDGADSFMVTLPAPAQAIARENMIRLEIDMAERERQARLRRWQTPPHPNRKGR
jgi:hypothetical protein